MLNINNIPLIFNVNPVKAPLKSALLDVCPISDTVSFKGKTLELSEREKATAQNLLIKKFPCICAYSDRKAQVLSALTPKSYPYFEKILNLSNKFEAKHIFKIVNYINKESVSTKDLDKKFKIIEDLPNLIIKSTDKVAPEFSDVYKTLEPNVYVDLIRTDVLTTKNQKLLPLNESLDLVFKTLKHKLDYQENKSSRVSSIIRGLCRLDTIGFISLGFSTALIAARTMGKDALNELLFNKIGAYMSYAKRLRQLSDSDYELLRNLCQNSVEKKSVNGKPTIAPMSVATKMESLDYVALNRKLIEEQKLSVNMKKLLPQTFWADKTKNVINMEKVKEEFIVPILSYMGVSVKDAKKYKENYLAAKKDNFEKVGKDNFWDIDYISVLPFQATDKLKDLVKHTTQGTFEEYIHNMSNEIGRINNDTEKTFTYSGIDYNKWLKPEIEPDTTELLSKNGDKPQKLTIKVWDRNPYKSLFDGNYTTCCTGIAKSEGKSFIEYMLNTTYNIAEVKDTNGKTVGMSRLFMADLDGVPTMVVENLEVNNNFSKNYLHNMKNKIKYREFVFDYIRKFSKYMNPDKYNPVPTYFSSMHYKIKDIDEGLEDSNSHVALPLGQITDGTYINSYGGKYFSGNGKLKLHLINIS